MSQFIGRVSMYPKQISFILAVTTAALSQPVLSFAQVQQEEPRTRRKKCSFYGCPLLPVDINYDPDAKEALEAIRKAQREQLESSSDDESSVNSNESLMMLESSGDSEKATLTLIGYKGGRMASQINQDRAFVVSPFHIREYTEDDNDPASDAGGDVPQNRLLGVFDGHAALGEHVSEYTVVNLPKLLSSKLEKIAKQSLSAEQEDDATKVALIETFVELDKRVPAEESGGCTASVVLQKGSKIYIANAGDSISFIIAYHKNTGKTNIVYQSREDKPHLPDERARVEAAGGSVYIPRGGGTTRVLYTDPVTGARNGLAMSRSIGDWEVGKFGVIPDPIVDVLDIPEIVAGEMSSLHSCMVVSDLGEVAMESCTAEEISDNNLGVDDVHIFAVSATDGLTDYVSPEDIATAIATSLFDPDGPHPLSGCEHLITIAATGWHYAKQGRYRDDISIAVSKIRTPPSAS